MNMCSKSWKGVGCVSEALPGRDVCAVHAKRPDYAPPTGDLVEIDLDLNSRVVVEECVDEDAECSECDGSGEHECTCGDSHDCKDCDGRGRVSKCRFCESAIDDGEPTEAQKREHLLGCRAMQTFIEHMQANTLTRDEERLYAALMKDIGPVEVEVTQ